MTDEVKIIILTFFVVELCLDQVEYLSSNILIICSPIVP